MAGDPDYLVARKGGVWIQVEAYFLPKEVAPLAVMEQLTTAALAKLP